MGLGFLQPAIEIGHLAGEFVDRAPLRRDGLVEILDHGILMGHPCLQGIDTGFESRGFRHGRPGSDASAGPASGTNPCPRATRSSKTKQPPVQ